MAQTLGASVFRAFVLVQELLEGNPTGDDLSDNAVTRRHPDLHGAAETHFGWWKEAVEAIWLDYTMVRRTESWSRDKVLARLRERLVAGLPCTDSALRQIDMRLWNATKKYFGTVIRAVEAAKGAIDGEMNNDADLAVLHDPQGKPVSPFD